MNGNFRDWNKPTKLGTKSTDWTATGRGLVTEYVANGMTISVCEVNRRLSGRG